MLKQICPKRDCIKCDLPVLVVNGVNLNSSCYYHSKINLILVVNWFELWSDTVNVFPGKPDGKGTGGRKNFNRFTTFVKSGGEGYILNPPKIAVREEDKVYIYVSGSCVGSATKVMSWRNWRICKVLKKLWILWLSSQVFWTRHCVIHYFWTFWRMTCILTNTTVHVS